MRKLLSPIESYGETGIVMVTGDGICVVVNSSLCLGKTKGLLGRK
jgi:hypothetical protein